MVATLVGRHAERDDPVQRSNVAHRVVYRPLYDALPPCGGCPGGALARALFAAEVLP